MIVSINQPAYLPWLGYFERIAASDLHVVLDHVQFEKGSFVNRNKVRTRDGWTWLTVPVRTKGRFGAVPIATLEIDDASGWRRKHWETLRQSYGRARYFDVHAPFFASVYEREWPTLGPLCAEITGYLLRELAISTPLVASDALDPGGAKDELVLDLCLKTGARTYLSGALGRSYLREPLFAAHGIEVSYQDYDHPIYSQLAWPFEPGMAAVDLLFNHGPAGARIVTGERRAA